MEQSSALMTSAEVRTFLNISNATLWRGVKSHAIPAPIKILSTNRWRRTDIEALVNGAPTEGGEE